MSSVEVLAPERRTVELEGLLRELAQPAEPTLTPFSDVLLAFFSDLSTALFRSPETRPYPAVQALAFWCRKAELVRLREEFQALQSERRILVPRGLVFHIPPANVDTLFIYSWVLAALTGNRNLIRLSPNRQPQTEAILAVLNRQLADARWAALRRTLALVSYGHESEITAQISAHADVRVIWGGDDTIAAIRRVPLPPSAKELTFADRSSFALIDAAAYLDLPSEARRDLADRFFNDAFWFDQLACSSPRFVFWRGGEETATAAARSFFAELRAVTEAKAYTVDGSTAMQRFAFACEAVLREPVTGMTEYDGAFAVLSIPYAAEVSREHCGGGLFYNMRLGRLEDLADFVRRKDQTLAYFGVPAAELGALASSLNGKGIDRIVPLGEALTFNRFWDGQDLLQEFTRGVYLQAGTSRTAAAPVTPVPTETRLQT